MTYSSKALSRGPRKGEPTPADPFSDVALAAFSRWAYLGSPVAAKAANMELAGVRRVESDGFEPNLAAIRCVVAGRWVPPVERACRQVAEEYPGESPPYPVQVDILERSR